MAAEKKQRYFIIIKARIFVKLKNIKGIIIKERKLRKDY